MGSFGWWFAAEAAEDLPRGPAVAHPGGRAGRFGQAWRGQIPPGGGWKGTPPGCPPGGHPRRGSLPVQPNPPWRQRVPTITCHTPRHARPTTIRGEGADRPPPLWFRRRPHPLVTLFGPSRPDPGSSILPSPRRAPPDPVTRRDPDGARVQLMFGLSFRSSNGSGKQVWSKTSPSPSL